MKTITTDELHERHLNKDDSTLVDVRGAAEFASGHVPGAINIPHTEVAARLSEIPKDKPVLVHCRMGPRAQAAATVLEQNGYDVYCVSQGGMMEWLEKSYPAE
jgi:rhodanese-related sulfurtransferase